MEKIKNIVNKAIEEISMNSIKNGSGIWSGFTKLDAITQGFHGGELTVIASRPGMGKSSFISSLIRNISIDFNKSVLFISLESKSYDVINRMICSETGLEYKKLKRGSLEPHEWE